MPPSQFIPASGLCRPEAHTNSSLINMTDAYGETWANLLDFMYFSATIRNRCQRFALIVATFAAMAGFTLRLTPRSRSVGRMQAIRADRRQLPVDCAGGESYPSKGQSCGRTPRGPRLDQGRLRQICRINREDM
jgi:hypothetical protein